MSSTKLTRYFDEEGRPSMKECIESAADFCLEEDIATLLIFTGTGDGPLYFANELLVREEKFESLKVVAVTPPFNRPYRQEPGNDASPLILSGIRKAVRDELFARGIHVVSAHLPFKEIHDGNDRTSEWKRVADAYGVLGGGFALCIQAVLVACDAGLLDQGERVVVAAADTALVVRTCRTEMFLSPWEGLIVEHIICRPSRYNISKPRHEAFRAPEPVEVVVETTGSDAPPPQLPPAESSAVESQAEIRDPAR